MKKRMVILLMALLSINFLLAENPSINVQGVLRDDDGKAINGPKQMSFKLYNSAEGGSEVWSQSAQTFDVANGVYNVELSGFTGVPFDTTYYLQITVDSEEMQDRIPLSMSPYSLAVRGEENVFPSSGNVGIGTDSPDSKLAVSGGHIKIYGGDVVLNTDSKGIEFSGGAKIFKQSGSGLKIKSHNTSYGIEFLKPDGTHQAIIKNGNVGIGTNSPSAMLDVTGTVECNSVATDYIYDNDDIDINAGADGGEGELHLNVNGQTVFKANKYRSVYLGITNENTNINGKVSLFGQVDNFVQDNTYGNPPTYRLATSDCIVTAYIEDLGGGNNIIHLTGKISTSSSGG
jgi:hypothetical protein